MTFDRNSVLVVPRLKNEINMINKVAANHSTMVIDYYLYSIRILSRLAGIHYTLIIVTWRCELMKVADKVFHKNEKMAKPNDYFYFFFRYLGTPKYMSKTMISYTTFFRNKTLVKNVVCNYIRFIR